MNRYSKTDRAARDKSGAEETYSELDQLKQDLLDQMKTGRTRRKDVIEEKKQEERDKVAKGLVIRDQAAKASKQLNFTPTGEDEDEQAFTEDEDVSSPPKTPTNKPAEKPNKKQSLNDGLAMLFAKDDPKAQAEIAKTNSDLRISELVAAEKEKRATMKEQHALDEKAAESSHKRRMEELEFQLKLAKANNPVAPPPPLARPKHLSAFKYSAFARWRK